MPRIHDEVQIDARRAFVTGSRAYGTPHPDSDLDLCVLVDKEALAYLLEMHPSSDSYGPEKSDYSFKFGRLNLLAFKDESVFEAWRRATARCVRSKPVLRKEAIAVIEAELKKIGKSRA